MTKPKLVALAPVRDLATFAKMVESLQGVADLAEQLRKKRAVMLAHWRDFDQFFLPPHL